MAADVEDHAALAHVAHAEFPNGARSSSSRSNSTGSPRFISRVARPFANRLTEISRAAPIPFAASSNPTSCAKSDSGPTSTSMSPWNRSPASTSTMAVRRLNGAQLPVRAEPANRLAQRIQQPLAPLPGRRAAP